MRTLRRSAAVAVLAGLWLAAGGASAQERECLDKKAEKEALRVVLQPPTSADQCLLDSSQCRPSDPVPVVPQVTPPNVPQLWAPALPSFFLARGEALLGFEEIGSARRGVTRDLLRPPR